MLVLSRRMGEKIWIGPDVCVSIVKIEGGKVRLGISASTRTIVLREELFEPFEIKEKIRRLEEEGVGWK